MNTRLDRKQIRQDEAKERNAAYAKLTPAQKLARLDAKLGKDIGAIKQRSKLQAALNVQPIKSAKEDTPAPTSDNTKDNKKSKYQRKKRS